MDKGGLDLISFRHTGDFSKTLSFLQKTAKGIPTSILEQYGREGVAALSANTPVESGLTANSWTYKTRSSGGVTSISWHNTNVVNGTPIAIILQYGHGTQNGGWIQGRDYINPAIKPIFDKIQEQVWREVNK